MQEQIKKIRERIDGYQLELDKWNQQWKNVESGEINILSRPYMDMILRMQAMYAYQITELKWVLKEVFNVSIEEQKINCNK